MSMMQRCLWLISVLFAAIAVGAQDSAGAAAIRDIHSRVLTPSSDALFAVETSEPSTDAAWTDLQRQADALAKAARALSVTHAQADKRWRELATDLASAALTAKRAARAHVLEELVAANGKIVATCEACHDDYRDAGHGMTSDKNPRAE